MDLATALIPLLSTSSVTAVVLAIIQPRTEARRRRREIAANSATAAVLKKGQPRDQLEREISVQGFHLVALTLVRFERWLTVLVGIVAIVAVAAAGLAIALVAAPAAHEFQREIAIRFESDPMGAWLTVIGGAVVSVALGWLVVFIPSQAIKSARTLYVRDQIAAIYGADTVKRSRFTRLMQRIHRVVTDALFTRD